MRRLLLLLLSLLLTALVCKAPPAKGLGRIITRPASPRPPTETVEAWANAYLAGPELWGITSLADVAYLAAGHADAPALYKAFRSFPRPENEFSTTNAFVEPRFGLPYLEISADLKAQLPRPLLHHVYRWLLADEWAPLAISFPSAGVAQSAIASFGLPSESVDRLRQNVYGIGNRFYFFYTPDIAPYLNAAARSPLLDLLRRMASEAPQNGVDADFIYTFGDDLAAIARRFAGKRDPAVVQTQLREALRSSPTTFVQVPLQNLLPPEVRDQLGRFAHCASINCTAAALAASEERTPTADSRFFSEELLQRDFRNLPQGEPLQLGDLLLYIQGSYFRHLAMYIADDLLLTKNGTVVFAPTQFQPRREMEKVYRGTFGFISFAYRRRKVGEELTVEELDTLPVPYEVRKATIAMACARTLVSVGANTWRAVRHAVAQKPNPRILVR